MAQIALTFVDTPDGRVDIQVYVDGVTDGDPPTPAQKLVQTMLQSAKEESQITDLEVKDGTAYSN